MPAVEQRSNRTSRTPLPRTTALAFTYDNIYQLKTAKQGTTTKESYTYDLKDLGNRLTSLGASNSVYNSSNELTSLGTTTYKYDNNGNLTSRQTATLTWDFENRLTQLTQPQAPTTVTFKYDPFGRRIYKSSSLGTSIYVYDGDNQIEEVNASGTAVARYTQGLGIDEPLAMLRGTTTDYYEADGLGSITSLTDSTAAVAATYTYNSFGIPLTTTGTLTNPFQFTARELDSETGWYYYRARYYAPYLGRFLSEDPIRLSAGINFYDYVSNRPTLYLDPRGLLAELYCERIHSRRGGGVVAEIKRN